MLFRSEKLVEKERVCLPFLQLFDRFVAGLHLRVVRREVDLFEDGVLLVTRNDLPI